MNNNVNNNDPKTPDVKITIKDAIRTKEFRFLNLFEIKK